MLIVEDDERLSKLIQQFLINNGFITNVERNGAFAAERILNESPDIVILDIMLPGQNGLQICKQVHLRFNGKILMLTARGTDHDHVKGLEIGADDYVSKPVNPRVLLARIRALLRRTTDKISSDTHHDKRLTFGNLIIDASIREVSLDGKTLDLTSAEFDLLWLLSSNAGRILSREEIFEQLRGIEYDGQDRSIDVRVSRIRPKVGDDPMNPRLIKTIRSKGYLFVGSINNNV